MNVEITGACRQGGSRGSVSSAGRERMTGIISVAAGRFISRMLLVFLVWLCTVEAAFAVEGSRTENSIALFSQGRSAVDREDREGTRQEALRDFLVQAVIQAAARILTPADLETRYSSLSQTVFSRPERYVLSYKISSEGVEEGNVYRIAGQVSVDVDLLKNDLPRRAPDASESPSTASGAIPAGPPPTEPADKGDGGDYPHRESPGSKRGFKKVLWAVAEQWGEGWHVPRSSVDPEATFSAFVSQEVRDFGWSLVFPPPGLAQPDEGGSLEAQAVLAAARAQGATHAVVGRLGFEETPGGTERLSADLAVLNVASAKKMGAFQQGLSVDTDTAEEKAMELAALAVPRLDRMLGQTDSAVEDQRSGGPRDDTLTDLPEGEGLVLRLRSRQPQADWEEIEGIIRRKAGSLQVLGLRFTRDGGIVQLQGVDKRVLLSLNGFALQGNAALRVEDPSPEGNALNLTIVQSETHQTNQ